MKVRTIALLVLGAAIGLASAAAAYPARQDVIWARQLNAGQDITLDGVLSEPGWAVADSHVIRYRIDAGIPGSGWQEEGGVLATDRTYATIKFLAKGDSLYMAAIMRDGSVGGSIDFNRFDGLLMNLKDHSVGEYPAPVREFLYSWWYPDLDTLPGRAVGKMPRFWGYYENNNQDPRTPEQVSRWDAATTVQGTTNRDSLAGVFEPDAGYVVEMRWDVSQLGYDITRLAGDIVEWNVSVYDCDYFWNINIPKFSSNRTWWQSPWGNVGWYHQVRIHARPDVTVDSGALTDPAPEFIVPNAGTQPEPVIDGDLSDPVWALAPQFDIRFGDNALRETYPGVARWRAGQFQPEVNGGQAFVFNPGDATVRYFFKGEKLFLAFDVRDEYVQYYSLEDRWDGIRVTINDRAQSRRNRDRVLGPRSLTFRVGADGQEEALEFLPFLRDTALAAKIELQLKAGTILDTTGLDAQGFDQIDTGWTAEMSVVLDSLGYQPGLGDGLLFMGITLYDGDSLTPPSLSYGTRAWWFREREGQSSSVWGYLDPSVTLVGVEDGGGPAPAAFALSGNTPNPFRGSTTLNFALPQTSDVRLEVYDVQGRMVADRAFGTLPAGRRSVSFIQSDLGAGLYLYRLRMADPASGAARATLSGKMMVVR